ncbi:GntR family transcriptional regulator [Microbacterium sp. A196]|uniref:GntR family transcriptional regulator n=1 Tax=Microbacterium sp. A196 TaxID=3457320 RepID=UPI003FD38FFC
MNNSTQAPGVTRTDGAGVRPTARTTAEAIAHSIRADIIGGRYESGERLRQVEIAKEYDVSTTPVREAFGLLQRQGLVQLHPQRGASAVVPNKRDLDELYEIRIELECLAVQRAAENFTPEDAVPLRALIERMRACKDAEEHVELNHRFHMGIYRVAQRARLYDMIEQLRASSKAYLQITSGRAVQLPGDFEHEHDDIIDACEANDPSWAARATRDHLRITVRDAKEELDNADTARDRADIRAVL